MRVSRHGINTLFCDLYITIQVQLPVFALCYSLSYLILNLIYLQEGFIVRSEDRIIYAK